VLHPLGHRPFRRARRLSPETDSPQDPRPLSVFAVIRPRAGTATYHRHGHTASIHADCLTAQSSLQRRRAVVVTVTNN
jgi:hypothetical protein